MNVFKETPARPSLRPAPGAWRSMIPDSGPDWNGLPAWIQPMLRWLLLGLLLGPAVAHANAPGGEVPLGGDFTLNTPAGKAVTLSSLKGKVVLLYFGFTYCPEMCPTELLQFQHLLSRLPADKRARVQPVFVSVDPTRDTPEVLAPYIAHFGGGILALTGKEEQLRKVAAQYGATFRYVPTGSSYTVDHTVNTYVVDPQGRLSRVFMYGSSTKDMADYVLSLLQE